MISRRPRLAAAAAAAAAIASCSGHASPTPRPRPSGPHPTQGPVESIGVLGDFGVDAPATRDVLAQLAKQRIAALITTGDNAYESGTPGEAANSISLLKGVLKPGVRLVASLGNHDELETDGQAVMSAFRMPARWYSTTIGQLQVIVLDGNVAGDAGQLAWLKSTLAAPRTTSWRVAVFHQPLAACSLHAADDEEDEKWLPLFHSGGVDLVLSGHNHTYERFDADGLPLVTTGGGGAELYSSGIASCTGPAKPKVLKSTHSFVRLDVGASTLRLRAIDDKGDVIDTLTLGPR